MPAQELSEAGKYLAGAYGVFLALLLVYGAIMATKLSRMERELSELVELADLRERAPADAIKPQRERERV
jgi:hypothetical protein